MKTPITQEIWLTLSSEEQRQLKYIAIMKKKIEDAQIEINELSDDIRNAENLLIIHAFERLKEQGIKDGAMVTYKPTNTVHTLSGLWLDRENGLIATNLSPMPKLKMFQYAYAHELELAKEEVKTKKKVKVK